MAKSGGSADALMGSSSSLLRVRSRARIDANPRPTPPSSHEMQVSGVVGDGDEQADRAAGRADGEDRGSWRSPELDLLFCRYVVS
jgi:hypothetical protein